MTGNKTEKKRISSKIFVALAALTLVSCCFLGTTFARYTTGTMSGEAGADIADWEIVIEDINNASGSEEGSFAVLSPAQEEYVGSGDNATGDRTHELPGSGTVVKISNNGQVDAEVTIAIDEEDGVAADGVKYYVKDYEVDAYGNVVIQDGKYVYHEEELVTGQEYHDQQGRTYRWNTASNAPEFSVGGSWVVPTEWQNISVSVDSNTLKGIAAVIRIGDLVVSEPYEQTEAGFVVDVESGSNVSIELTSAVWYSDLTSDNGNKGNYGDLRDSWIGANISKVGYTFTWSAVQASERP